MSSAPTNSNQHRWIDTAELAELFSLSPATVRTKRCRKPDDLPPHYLIGGAVRYRLDEALQWAEERRQVGSESSSSHHFSAGR
ncbi:MAG: helix-turn-helix domain-containing protein [Thermoanaerobaculia bacterium]|nr:helix-turn-helix domain-containing protein [Thermoanaerobaculia bacterium]